MSVFLASPYVVEPPAAEPVESPWRSSQHTWTGWDGSMWDLSGGSNGVVLASGVRGMHMPPIQRYATKAPAVAGSFWRGSVTDERDVFWPTRVFSDQGSQAWVEHNRRWWNSLNPDQTGLWSVIQPSGLKRSLRCRFVSESDDADDISPELVGWTVYGINLVAEQPYWTGESVTHVFTSGAGQNYYGGSGGGGFGPPFYISVGSTMDAATFTNAGDVAAWPTWKVNGPSTAAQVGVGGRFVSFPFTLADGQWVRINTDPTDQVARDQDGNDRTAELGLVDFAEIPRGTSVPLSLTMTGTGTVEATITPRYFRAL